MSARGIFGARSVAVATVVGLPVAAASLLVAVYQASGSQGPAPPGTPGTPATPPSRAPAGTSASPPPAATTSTPPASGPATTGPATTRPATTAPAAPRSVSPSPGQSGRPPDVETGRSVTPAVRWTGDSWLSSGGLDLDARPPRRGDAGSDLRKDYYTEVTPGRGARLERRLGDGKPDYEQCRTAAEAGPDLPLFDLPEGGWFCVFTTEGRVAAARSLGLDETGRSGFAITVWQR